MRHGAGHRGIAAVVWAVGLAGKLSFIDVAAQALVRQVKAGCSPHGAWTLDHVARR